MKTEEITALYAQSTYLLSESGSIAAPRFQPPSQLNCQWRLMVVCRSGSWILSLGETSGTAPLILLLEFLRGQSKALVWYQPLLSQALEPGLLSTDHQQQPAPSTTHPISQLFSDGQFALCWLCNNCFSQHLHPLWLVPRRSQAPLQALCVISQACLPPSTSQPGIGILYPSFAGAFLRKTAL